MFTLAFWKATFERAVKTFAQVAAGLLTGNGLGILTVDWVQVGSIAGLGLVLSVLTSIATGALSDGSPSAGNVEALPTVATGKHAA